MALIHVCDECHSAQDVTTYTVSDGERTAEVDRCKAHGGELQAVLDGAPAKPVKQPQTARRSTRRRSTPITTPEEIEARKKA